MPLELRYMRVSDLHDVIKIEGRAFATPWPLHSYVFEIKESTHSFMAVLHEVAESAPTDSSIRRLIRNFTGSWESTGRILGYGGLWNIMEEAHISTVASHPDERGKRYGEVILAAMVRKSIKLHAEYIVLEVRKRNVVAQSLYHKYNFQISGEKSNYYQDGEDAYDMRLNLTDAAVIARFNTLWVQLRERVAFADYYTDTLHPRLKR
jgi:[ribosomal protein S18]-alanine N-acetyltransferase